MPNIQIEVCQRLGDYSRRMVCDAPNNNCQMREFPKYHAQIAGHPELWACGDSPDDAIGNLVRCHSEKFGVEIAYLEGRQPR